MKRFISLIIALCLACTLLTSAFAVDYYPRYSGNSDSLVDALECVGAADTSFSYREHIAAMNGISNYSGTAGQNQYLLQLLKSGQLVQSGYSSDNCDSAITNVTTENNDKYFPVYSGSSESLVDALNELQINSSYSYRSKIAICNGINNYCGSASQNTFMLDSLKCGTLMNPDYSSANASSYASQIHMHSDDLSIKENYGYEDQIYIVSRDRISVRTKPYVTGEKIASLEKGTPILGKGLYTNSKGHNWVQLVDREGNVSWVYSAYLTPHNDHTYIDLTDYGYEGFEVCTTCGNVQYTKSLNENGGIVLSTSDKAHLALAACSFAPLVGNFCDAGDALLSLYEGDYTGFAINLVAMIPLLGYAADAGKTVKVLDTADNMSVTIRVLEGGEFFEVVGKNNKRFLNSNMANMFELTDDIRFLKRDGFAAHHIVEFSDSSEAAQAARRIMEQYDIDLNSAANGVYLCSNPSMCFDVGGALHTGRHVSGYSDAVLQRLESALDATSSLSMKEQRDALIEALDQIARDLMRNDLRLQKVA